MDADDIAFPDRFATQLDYLQKHPGVVLLGGRSVVIDAGGNSLGVLEPPSSPTACAKLLARSNCMCHPSTMFMRHAFEYCGGYREEYAPAEDYDLWLRLMEIGEVANVPDFILAYRYHADNLSSLRTRKQVLASLSGHLSYHRRTQGLSDVAYGEDETADSVAHDAATNVDTVRAYIERRFRWNIRQAQRLLPEKFARRMFREYIETMNRRDPDGRIWSLVESWPGRHDNLGDRGP